MTNGVSGGRVAGVLQALYDEHKALTPELVVDAARPEDSLIHDQFEWDDQVAGEQHRLSQARRLIRTIKVTYAKDLDGTARQVNRYQSTRVDAAPGSRVYRDVGDIVQNQLEYQMLLRQMEIDWARFQRRYSHLKEFHDLVTRVDEAG